MYVKLIEDDNAADLGRKINEWLRAAEAAGDTLQGIEYAVTPARTIDGHVMDWHYSALLTMRQPH